MNLKRYGKLVPEKAIPIFGLRLVVYLDETGTQTMDWRIDGDVRIDQLIGTLELFKGDVIASVEEPADG